MPGLVVRTLKSQSNRISVREKRILARGNAFRLLWGTIRHERRLLLLGSILFIFNRAFALILPASTRYLVDVVLLQHNIHRLSPLLVVLVAAVLIQAVCSISSIRIFKKAEQRLIMELRSRTQAHVAKLSLNFFRHHRSGELASRIMSDIDGVRLVLGQAMLDFVGGIFTASLSFIVLFHLNAYLTTFVGLVYLGYTAALIQLIARVHPAYRHRNRAMAWVTGRLGETLGGITTVKGFAAEESEANAFRQGVERVRGFSYDIVSLEAWMNCLSILAGTGVGIWVIGMGVRMVVAGEMTPGSFLTYTTFLAYMVAPISMSVTLGTQLTEAFVGLSRTSELHLEPREEDDPQRTKCIEMEEATICFHDVTFRYHQDNTVLHSINFTAYPNQIVALVGSSGSGKTTIANLVCGFDTPDHGVILVNGTNLREAHLKEYRQNLGVVFQESFLFEGTLFENVAFFCSNSSPAKVLEACRAAGVDDFAKGLPNGYETTVGERGVKLSGGQRQRVAIARALLVDPKILILDEATASLDSESEASVQRALNVLMQGRTTLIIAHRLSTIKNADQILVLENGTIVERGTHTELFRPGTRYRQLWKWQTERENSQPSELSDRTVEIVSAIRG